MPRSFAIVPAAGESARMGAPKLLLPWRGRTVIEQVLAAWTASVDRAVVVVRGEDARLLAACSRFDVDVVQLDRATADMKASVQAGLWHLEKSYRPEAAEAVLVAPADLPRLSPELIVRLVEAHDATQPAAIVPTLNCKRGHPLLLPWELAQGIHDLAPDEGINALIERTPVREIEWFDASAFEDLDTVSDYARLNGGVPET